MKIAIGSDHAGFDAKEKLREHLFGAGHEAVDCGPGSEDTVDYPDYAVKVTKMVSSGECERGILICGTGIGMCMSANKVNGIRAALCHDTETARLGREHNDANVLCMGARLLNMDTIKDMTDIWIETGFEAGRHQRRVDKIMDIES